MSISALRDLVCNKDKRPGLVVLLGMVGMVLIMLSSFLNLPGGKSGGAVSQDSGILITTLDYAGEVEQKLEKVVGQIEGVGSLQVLVTVENGFEQVYAQSGKSSAGSETTYDSTGQQSRVQQSENVEHAYVLIDASGGKREALLITQIEPKIKGVVVVCQGADNMVVQERVISAVTTALGINSNRVCVIKKA